MADPVAHSPFVSVVIPAYNEEDTIGEVLERVLALPLNLEVVVVDDASTDRTAEIARSFDDRVRVFQQPENRGKGAAIRRAVSEVRGEIVAIQDADLEYSPEDLPVLVEAFKDASVSAVYGTRFRPSRPPMRFANYVANRILAITVNVLFRGHLTDEATCYKLIRTDELRSLNLRCERFEFCPEVTAKLLRKGARVVEMPIRYTPRTYGQGKKITWRDGFEAFWTLLKYRFAR
ncbi:MAG: glycosyltransferase family 2 protein [Armatimonadetes bacterium]|nr:glycosyltransferase family 2 protein [Armatimonadota bacterium]